MLGLICYLMPSFISLGIYNSKEKTELRKLIIHYGIYCVINNLLTLLVFYAMNIQNTVVIDFNVLQFAFKYLFGSMIFSIITPYMVKIITTNIEIKVEVKKIEKTKKNNK